jgi:hypothetical protein
MFLLDSLEFLVIGLSESDQALLDGVNLCGIALVLLRQVIVVLLLVDVDLPLH